MAVVSGVSLSLADELIESGGTTLEGPLEVDTAVIGGTTFVYSTSYVENAIQVSTLDADGTLTPVGSVLDGPLAALNSVIEVKTFTVGGVQMLVIGSQEDGISTYILSDTAPYLTLADTVFDSENVDYNLSDVWGIGVVEVGGTAFIYAGAQTDNGLSIFSVDATGALTHVDDVPDTAALAIDAIYDIEAFELGGTNYIVVAGSSDDGMTVFSVNSSTGALSAVDTVTSGIRTDTYSEVYDIQVAVVGSNAYIYTSSQDGIGGVNVTQFNGGSLTHIQQVTSAPNSTFTFSLDLFQAGDSQYIAAFEQSDADVSLYQIAPAGAPNQGQLVPVGAFETTGIFGETVYGSTSVVVDGQVILLAAGFSADAVRSYLVGGGDDVVVGTMFSDTLIGGGGNDVLLGLNGSNLFDGGAGADQLFGGDSTDTADYSGSDSGVTVNLALGLALGGDAEGDTFFSIEAVVGSDFVDVITAEEAEGGALSDLLMAVPGLPAIFYGETGNDTLIGDSANDYLDGGASQDSLVGNDGNDTLVGGPGNDTLDGGAGYDYILYSDTGGTVDLSLAVTTAQNTGAGGTDTLLNIEGVLGGIGNDRFVGSTADNLLDGASGSDNLFGLGGNDTLLGQLGNDVLNGGGGNDFLVGGFGLDNLNGGPGDDTLDGGSLNDQLIGGTGADLIDGGPGRDILVGGTFSGGSFVADGDADTFHFGNIAESTPGGQRDIIRDFEPGTDIIDLSLIDADELSNATNEAFIFIGSAAFSGLEGELRVVSAGASTLVQADVNGDGISDFELRLDGAPTLTASDFIL